MCIRIGIGICIDLSIYLSIYILVDAVLEREAARAERMEQHQRVFGFGEDGLTRGASVFSEAEHALMLLHSLGSRRLALEDRVDEHIDR